MPLRTVSAWLGHSSVRVTAEKYIRTLGPLADADMVARLNAALDSGGVRGTRAEAGERRTGRVPCSYGVGDTGLEPMTSSV